MSYFDIFCSIIAAVLLIALCAVLVALVFFIMDYATHIPTERQLKIKYSDFIKWISVEKEYNFNHTNWQFKTYGPSFGYCCEAYYCYFNFFDYCKYRVFLIKYNRSVKEKDMDYRRSYIINHINKEIQEFSQLNEKK